MKWLAIKPTAVRRSARHRDLDWGMQYRETENEAGYVLVAVIFLTVALLISLAVAAPKMAMSIQRDRELETIHRGEQYRRAIQLYYRQFGNYPTSIDQLLNTNNVRFLRKRYTDPLTGKDDWKPVLYGHAHVRPLGFFGQPLMGVAGIGTTTGSMYAASTSTTDANGVPIAGGDTSGSGSTGASGTTGFGSGPSFGGMTPGSGMGGTSTGSSMFGSSANGSTPGSTGLGAGGSGSAGFGSTGTGFGSSTAPGTGTSATTFGGGGPIVGVTLPVDKPSLIDYKEQTRYNKWEFNYDPMEDQANALGGLTNGASTGGLPTTNSPFGGTNPMGGTNPTGGTSPLGSSSPMGSTGPTAGSSSPTSPQ